MVGVRGVRGRRRPLAIDAQRAALSSEFGAVEGRVWLNAAHQGPLPESARRALSLAVSEKSSPWRMDAEDFAAVPSRLRESLAQLLGAPAEEIALANSASYGLDQLARALPLRAGDEVLLVEGDFPATVLAWLALSRRGVRIRFLELGDDGLPAEALAAAIGPRTRVFCTSWTFSFTGHTLDLDRLGQLCRERDVRLIVNGSQAVGSRPVDVTRLPIDALVGCGHKWLCGPYATGYLWLGDELLDGLEPASPYWQRISDLGSLADSDPTYTLGSGARQAADYDVFATGNFFNVRPWTAAIDHLLAIGLDRIEAHNQALVDQLTVGLDNHGFTLVSPHLHAGRSALVLASHRDPAMNRQIAQALAESGIDVALRNNRLRFSPHLYNTRDEIERTLETLAPLSGTGTMRRPRPATSAAASTVCR